MALPPQRSRPLHNFILPTLRWANQRHLRCKKIDDTHQPNSSNPGSAPPASTNTHHRSSVHESPVRSNDYEGIDAVREKVMSDFRIAAKRMKFTMLEEKEKEKQQQLTAVPAGANANKPNSNSPSLQPCNLRTRRAACKEPSPPASESPRRANGGNNSPNRSPESPVVTDKSTRLRNLGAAVNTAGQILEGGDNSKRAKFTNSLTREEIDRDFLLITGKKPPRRPKKRNRNVQKQVNYCAPGLWLSEVTPDTYKVPDIPGKYTTFKLNTDGASKVNTGSTRIGDIIKDQQENYVCGFTKSKGLQQILLLNFEHSEKAFNKLYVNHKRLYV